MKEGVDYEVVWDGTHTGHDEDLLNAPAVPTKVLGTMTEKKRLTGHAVLDTLAIADGYLSIREIAARSGLTHQQVQNAVAVLGEAALDRRNRTSVNRSFRAGCHRVLEYRLRIHVRQECA